jgi:hypothetical protein
MFITKTNKIRHQLLEILVEYGNKKPAVDLTTDSIHFDLICSKLPSYDRAFILDNLDFLQSNKLIYCSMEFDNSKFHILSNGNHAYNERKFLREGIKDQMNYIYDIVKNISVIVLLIIGVWSFFINLNQTRQNSTKIDKQEVRIKAIEDSIRNNMK